MSSLLNSLTVSALTCLTELKLIEEKKVLYLYHIIFIDIFWSLTWMSCPGVLFSALFLSTIVHYQVMLNCMAGWEKKWWRINEDFCVSEYLLWFWFPSGFPQVGIFSEDLTICTRDFQSCSWRAKVLQSLTPTWSNTCAWKFLLILKTFIRWFRCV